MNVQQSLVRLFNSRWQDCSNLTGTIDQQSLALFFNSYRYSSSTVTGTIAQQSLPWLLKSHWHDYSTVAGIVFQQLQARMFNRHWHDCLAVTGKIFSFFILAEFFISDIHCWRIMPCTRNTIHDPDQIKHFLIYVHTLWAEKLQTQLIWTSNVNLFLTCLTWQNTIIFANYFLPNAPQ